MNDNVIVDEPIQNDNDATDTMTNKPHDKSKSKVTKILIKHVPFPHKLARAKLEKKYMEVFEFIKKYVHCNV